MFVRRAITVREVYGFFGAIMVATLEVPLIATLGRMRTVLDGPVMVVVPPHCPVTWDLPVGRISFRAIFVPKSKFAFCPAAYRTPQNISSADPMPPDLQRCVHSTCAPWTTDARHLKSSLDDRYCDDGWTLRDVLRELNEAHSRTPSKFRAATGMSPLGYRQRLRLFDALYSLLTQPHRSIVDIAGASGFGDLSHFNRTFRTFFGAPPSSFRLEVINDADGV